MFKLRKILRASLALLVALCVTASAEVKVGEAAPDFAVKGLDGKSVPLKSLQGKTVVLEWINDGCPFVRGQYDSGKMQALQKKYAKDVVWIWIASSAPGKQGYHTAAEWKEIVKKEKASPAHVVLDPEGKIGRLYGAKTTPHMFVIDKKGQLVYQGAIDDKKDKNYVDAALKSLASGTKIAETTTKAYGCGVKYKD
jgi:peroxiredoxin